MIAMYSNFPLLSFLLLLVFNLPATAAVFERDWKTTGDGLLTYDDVNRREWLDLSETLLEQFPGVTLEERYQSVLVELDIGGIFENFRVAGDGELVSLAHSAGIDTSHFRNILNFDNNIDATGKLISLLTPTIINTPDRLFSIGVVDEPNSPFMYPERFFAGFFIDLNQLQSGIAGLILHNFDGLPTAATTGVMLYRQAVPEPNALVILLLGLFSISQTQTLNANAQSLKLLPFCTAPTSPSPKSSTFLPGARIDTAVRTPATGSLKSLIAATFR